MKPIYQNLVVPFLLLQGSLLAHCQVPCGIYNDAVRIIQIQEDFSTIQKAMTKIKELSQQQDATSMNQLTRWIMTKDDHASKIQKVVSDYFLTQRIKAKTEGSDYNTAGRLYFLLRLTHLLNMIFPMCVKVQINKGVDLMQSIIYMT